MNVESTERRIHYFLDLFERVGLRDQAASWLDGARPAHRQHRLVATLPADGWLLLSHLAFDDIYASSGHVRPKTPQYRVLALREVQTCVNQRRLHPALKQRGIVGSSSELVPCWQGEVFRHAFHSETWIQDNFIVLAPRFDGTFTNWLPVAEGAPERLGRDARLCEEREHLLWRIHP